MKRVIAAYSQKAFGGRSWNELVAQLDRAGYQVDSAYRDWPNRWIEVIKDGKIYDAEVTTYTDGSYEVVTDNIYLSNHNDLVDRVISQIGDIIEELDMSASDNEQARDIRDYLMQVCDNIQEYRSSNYE